MFPNSKDSPACTSQRFGHGSVARNVAGNFFLPVSRIVCGHPTMFWATVPKASIYKDGKPLRFEEKIWTPEN
jgi:hypothetical protein